MTNHLHLLLETINTPTKRIIQRTHSLYASYFNKRYDTSGHLFQGRYYADMIKDVSHFLTVSKYIHLNPVDAKMVPQPEDYRWSSYAGYMSSRKDPHIKTDKVLSYFFQSPIQNYRQYVEGSDPKSRSVL